MSRSDALLGWLDDTSDRLSPIVVKEVRQVVRGREFSFSFGASLLAGLARRVLRRAPTRSREAARPATWTFVALMGCLTLPRPGRRAARRVQRAAQRADGTDARAHHADGAVVRAAS